MIRCHWLRRLLAAAALMSCANRVAPPALAEIAGVAERPAGTVAGYRRQALAARGRAGPATYEIEAVLLRPAAAAEALLIEAAAEPPQAPENGALTGLALRRGMAVVFPALDKVPEPVRAAALRDLIAHLRKTAGVRRVIAAGAGRWADFLSGAAAGARFDGLLLQRASPVAAPADPRGPRVVEVFTPDAYWRSGPPAPAAEATEGANRRRFYLAGATGGEAVASSANCAAPVNPRSAAPALRALLVALDDWIAKGAAPPASRAPRPADRSLAAAGELRWPNIPGLPAPPRDARLAPAIDADGNETAGLRLPDHALPLGTFTGWNAAKDKAGPACRAGAFLPFAASKAERERIGDPRLSLVERYGSRAYFVGTMRAVADKLVKERLLLKEDADAYVAAAKQAPF